MGIDPLEKLGCQTQRFEISEWFDVRFSTQPTRVPSFQTACGKFQPPRRLGCKPNKTVKFKKILGIDPLEKLGCQTQRFEISEWFDVRFSTQPTRVPSFQTACGKFQPPRRLGCKPNKTVKFKKILGIDPLEKLGCQTQRFEIIERCNVGFSTQPTLAIEDLMVLNFVNHSYSLIFFLVCACLAFCVVLLPKRYVNKLSDHIFKKKFGKDHKQLIQEENINESIYEEYIKNFYLEIKQTFTFSLLMVLAAFLISKELTPETMLITFSTVYVYTFVFVWKDLWDKVKGYFWLTIIGFILNCWLLYMGWAGKGEYWWILSAIMAICTIFLQVIKYRIKYPNLINSNKPDKDNKGAHKDISPKKLYKHSNTHKNKINAGR